MYFKKIYPAAVESVHEVCELFRSGKPPHIEQDESQATYERRCTKKHAKIDWFKPVDQVYNLIRGTNPAPGAWTTYKGEEISIYDAKKLSGDGVTGRIMDVSDEGIEVQCVGGRILIKRVKPEGAAKLSASEWAGSINMTTSDTFGT